MRVDVKEVNKMAESEAIRNADVERTRRLVQISESLSAQKQEILLAFANGMAAMISPSQSQSTA